LYKSVTCLDQSLYWYFIILHNLNKVRIDVRRLTQDLMKYEIMTEFIKYMALVIEILQNAKYSKLLVI
jgi:hypothetical protein